MMGALATCSAGVAPLSRAYLAGRAAHYRCEARTASPHPPSTVEFTEWEKGWDEGATELTPAWRSSWPDDMGL